MLKETVNTVQLGSVSISLDKARSMVEAIKEDASSAKSPEVKADLQDLQNWMQEHITAATTHQKA
ncbi:hypothetical protein DET61_11982 [Marinobacter nauticus]|uniref:Uncharacterized protein n=1 Tax=Marinobacter nauticus TaxID=2743 RepID=A0A368X5L2_MARNT|nr:hypothetical protein [Marinobacter nauticus]RCW63312.1 hypothetical protein DET61_11982 [Marinobacter nauticus]